MKNFLKIGSILCLGAMLSAPAHALVGFGIKGGVNLNNASYSVGGTAVDNSFKSGMGFMGGLGIEAGMGPIGLLVDVLYAQRKYVFGSAFGSSADGYITAPSIYIPVQAKFSLMPMFAFTAGGYYSLAIGKSKTYSAAGNELTSEDGDPDFGAVAGISLNLAMLSIEARYNLGLKNQDTDPDSLKLNSIDLLIGYMF